MQVIQQLKQLVDLTRQLSAELDEGTDADDHLSETGKEWHGLDKVKRIQDLMDHREECIAELTGKVKSMDPALFSSFEQKKVESLFEEFDRLERILQESLRETLVRQETRVNEVTRNRQALKSYRKTSETPDISFY